ncbi:hypothetical protein [Acidimangrovimonas sediminis]|uniref:hypothetical protein n=1 Tax=Acidimangrovimonas sediminis TaxID=2056283 RepID=UPI0018ED2598|nr:hypothetical protein [Acidimangrovimonas sediminis]
MRFGFLAFAAVVALAGCGDTYASRGVSGAALGAGAAALTGNDAAAGAALGAGAGILTK